ncbi:fructosamine kinase family protein [Niabella yanshanensis]|uniref:Fructosamine kinase family protein n=1 Tax=Niabella yanshanensis TaxID=577386 RepID=A0ABZ0W7R6_9BACT|nr:fructosamine kinase family protein [Niabella yanshanensis]WQD38653.1 fructosamine kinase family protein [Niabella yanshanensis]
MVANNILNKLSITPKSIIQLNGGDINKAYAVTTATQRYFLKINTALLYPAMFIREANGLHILKNHSQLKVPEVIETGVLNDYQFLLLEWIEEDKATIPLLYQFGEKIAEMHLNSQPDYGLKDDNYIGSLPQINTLTSNWPEFYANCRLLPLVKLLRDKHLLSSGDVAKANQFCASIKNIFPEEKPALLHGDLWSGNYLRTASGSIAIFDPAVYYGHREMDIAMTKLFGGFPDEFYIGYNDRYPLEKGWHNRLAYAQLYPLLAHAVLFEQPYINRVRTILHRF